MRRSLFAVVFALLALTPLSAQTLSLVGKLAPAWVVQIVVLEADDTTGLGTGFCEPGQLHTVLTAGHVLAGGGFATFIDVTGKVHEPKIAVPMTRGDVGRIFLNDDDDLCVNSRFAWAAHNPEVGALIWMLGHPLGLSPVITTMGAVSSLPTDAFTTKGVQVAQLHGLPGSSGSPVLDAAGKVVGMMVSGTKDGTLNAFLPVEAVRKALR